MMTSNKTVLTVRIADLIISEVIYFNLDQKPIFKEVLDLERNVSNCSQPPKRNLIFKDILDIIYDQNMEMNLILIQRDSDIFGLLSLGDGDTFSRLPLLNILVSGKSFQ